MTHRWSLLLPVLLLACSQAPTPAPATPTPVASAPTAVASSDPPPSSGWTVMDPRAVRCGIDDRPNNILGANDIPRSEPPLLALRLVEAPAAPPPGVRARPIPTPSPVPMPIDMAEPMPDPPPPRLFVERLTPSLSTGAALPAELSTAFSSINPQYEVCNNLVSNSMTGGPVEFELELASTGAPLRVLPTAPGQPSVYTRCLMERTCQYQTHAALGQLTRVKVPLRVTRDQPRPPPPPPSVQAVVPVDAISEGNSTSEMALQVRSTAAEAARRCGAVPGRARVRFIVDMNSSRASLDLVEPSHDFDLSAPESASGIQRVKMMPSISARRFPPNTPRRPPTPFSSVSQVRTQKLEGEISTGVIGCVVAALTGRSFPGRATGSERVLITWNP